MNAWVFHGVFILNKFFKTFIVIGTTLYAASGSTQEWVSVGDIDWTGPAAESWALNPGTDLVGMVCNVEQGEPVTTYAAPDAASEPVKNIYRMAYVEVDTESRTPEWGKIVGARRCFDESGYRVECRDIDLPEAWVPIDKLCGWIDY